MLRADALQHRLSRGGARADSPLRATSSPVRRRSSRRRPRAPRWCARLTSARPREAGDAALRARGGGVGARASSSSPSSWSAGSGVEDVGAYYPHRVTYHPTCHALACSLGDAPLRLLRAVRGIDLVELEGAQECCGFGGTFAVKNADVSTAMLADKLRRILDTRAEVCCAADNSCLLHIGGGLSRLAPACAPCTSPRSWRPRNERRRRSFPEAARAALADSQLRRNIGKATTTIRAKRAAVVEVRADWEALREAGQALRSARCVTSTAISRSWRRPCRRAAARSTGRATPTRPTGSSATSPRAAGARRARQGQVADDRRDRAQRRARRRAGSRLGDRPGGADRAARPTTARRTSSCRRSTATAPRSASCSCARWSWTSSATSRARWPRRRAGTCGASSSRPRSRCPGRTSLVAETGSVCVVESEGNGRMCIDPAAGPHHRGRDREARPDLAGPRGVPLSCCRARRPASG